MMFNCYGAEELGRRQLQGRHPAQEHRRHALEEPAPPGPQQTAALQPASMDWEVPLAKRPATGRPMEPSDHLAPGTNCMCSLVEVEAAGNSQLSSKSSTCCMVAAVHAVAEDRRHHAEMDTVAVARRSEREDPLLHGRRCPRCRRGPSSPAAAPGRVREDRRPAQPHGLAVSRTLCCNVSCARAAATWPPRGRIRPYPGARMPPARRLRSVPGCRRPGGEAHRP